jgi:hypothetical protein
VGIVLLMTGDQDSYRRLAPILRMAGLHVTVERSVKRLATRLIAALDQTEICFVLADVDVRAIPCEVYPSLGCIDGVRVAAVEGLSDGLAVSNGRTGPALGDVGGRPSRNAPLSMHAAARLATAILRAIESPDDPKTLVLWGRSVGVSPTALTNSCRVANTPPKKALSFTRVLRAICRQEHEGVLPQDLLDVADLRTLAKLLALGNAPRNRKRTLPGTPEEFLHSQRWIANPTVLATVRRMLEDASLMVSGRGHSPSRQTVA